MGRLVVMIHTGLARVLAALVKLLATIVVLIVYMLILDIRIRVVKRLWPTMFLVRLLYHGVPWSMARGLSKTYRNCLDKRLLKPLTILRLLVRSIRF